VNPKDRVVTLYKLARHWWLGGMQRQVLRAIESEQSQWLLLPLAR
jgi:hypothetical protein